MDLIPSINLEYTLSSYEISIERKIKYFTQIGKILERMEHIRTHTTLKDFYLNDVYENNFIVDINTDNIRVIDIDSCKINNSINSTMGSKYLQGDTIIFHIPKYKQDISCAYGTSFIPSKETDLYCYIIMILNFMYGGDIEKLSLEELYDYLDYLSYIGVDSKLVNIFKKIMSNAPNENPSKLLHSLIPFYGRAHKNTYKHHKKR